MGNHEYCTECGLSSFHRGEPCPEWALEKHRKEQDAIKDRCTKADEAARRLVAELKKQGHEAVLTEYGHVQISKWSLI